MSKNEVRSGAAYLYVETISSMVASYVFWLVMSKITEESIIGTSSAMISFATIVTALATMGVPTSVQRLLGKSFIEKKSQHTSLYIQASLILVTLSVLLCSIAILLSKDWIYEVFNINFDLLIVSILLVASSVIRYLFRYVIIASLSTRVLVFSSIFPTVARFVTAIILILLGMGTLGLTIGYTVFPLLGTITLAPSIMQYLRAAQPPKVEISLFKSIKNILIGGVASWIPNLLVTIGSQLGTIVVLGSHGASQAGIYFIALSIFTAISTGMSVIFSITYPVMSAMQEGRRRLSWRSINLGLIISLPLSSYLIFYSKEIMHLFGQQYIEGASSLQILMWSMLPTAVMTGVSTLSYSYGNFRQVLLIGLAASIPRTLLYFILVPLYTDTGAAISNTMGSVLGFVVAVIIAKQIPFAIHWKDLVLIFLIPSAVALFVNLGGIHYILAIFLVLILSYLLYIKARILRRIDVEYILGILPISLSNPITQFVNCLAKKIEKSY